MNKFNSTIKIKFCKCGCGSMPKIGLNGYAKINCIPQEIKDADPEKYKRSPVAKRKAVNLNYLSKKVKAYAEEKIDEILALKCVNQNKWFKEQEKEVEKHPYCSECGKWIPPKFYRHAIAHIFPKAIFPSVATHPLNYLILAAGCCHDKTHRLDTFSQMICFKEAVERFKQFENQITEKHKYKDLFIDYAIKKYEKKEK